MPLRPIATVNKYKIGQVRCTNGYNETDNKIGILGRCLAPRNARKFTDREPHVLGIVRLYCRQPYDPGELHRALCPWCLSTLPWFIRSISGFNYFVKEVDIVGADYTDAVLHILSLIDRLNIEA